MRKRRDLDQRGRRSFLPKIFLAYRSEIDAVAHVGDVGLDLDHVGHRSALGFDERFYRVIGAARLSFEIAAKCRTTVSRVGDLAGGKKDGLGPRGLRALQSRSR